MRFKLTFVPVVGLTVALSLGAVFLAEAQQGGQAPAGGAAGAPPVGAAAGVAAGPAAGPAAGKTTEQAYQNIKVLQGMPAEQLLPLMTNIATSLGVGCPYCHTPPNFASDDKPPKSTARQMISMVQALNRGSFDNRNTVTCYTCHHGAATPASGPATGPPSGANSALTPAKLPTADEILAHYVDAIGGEQAVRKLSTRHVVESHEIQGQLPAEFERFAKAPNLSLTVMQAPVGTIATGYDGKMAWVQTGPANIAEADGQVLARARQESDFYAALDLKKEYPALALHGIEKSANHNLFRLDGFSAGGSAVQLFFDAQTGLLFRRVSNAWLAPGDPPVTTEYDDYTEVEGVKFPFTIREAGPRPNQRMEIHVEKLEVNKPIENARFAMPAPKPEPPWTQMPR